MRRSWWKKLPLWWLWQKRVLDKAELLVATCEKEYNEIRALGFKQPIVVLPIGLEVPTLEEKPQNTQKTQKEDLKLATSHLPLATENERLKRIVFFGRVHKVKAVDHLVKAWGQLQADFPDWELVIAGPDCGAKAELEAIIAEGNIPRVRFTGEINGQAKYDFLTEADIYVLPSHTENFGVTVAEALACGTPSIASQGTPWEGLETEQCGKWVPIGVEPLITALRELTSLTDEERAAMGQRGIEWIRRDFSWEGIGAKMKTAYAWLLGQGEKPDFVRVD
jgi:glycosyltransferase involved in cell wall biosynthesis